jgi:hypothetical protein
LCSLFDSSQNVKHIYEKILSSKRISTCSIISSIWILVKFWYSIYRRKVIMFLVKHDIQWWDEWLVISQMFLFAIASILVSRITKALESYFIRAHINHCLWCRFYYDSIDTQLYVNGMIFDANYVRQMCACFIIQCYYNQKLN